MERKEWLELLRESMVGFWGMVATSSPGGSVLEREGVFAAVIPAIPDRSVMNAVIPASVAPLADALGDLTETYERAGVRAWTVWIPEHDRASAELLAAAGHVLDAEPRAMGMELDRLEEPEPAGVDLLRGCGCETLSRVNDLAYGYPEGTFEPALGRLPAELMNTYAARVDGEIAAVMLTADHGRNCEASFVATLEAARGRGLATALMRQAVWDASRRGCRTATLQSTRLGLPVYRRVGFQDFGALQMWERRSAAA